jgi:outer membrane protein assembly factor BamB
MIYGGTYGHVFAVDEGNGREIWRTRLHTGGFLGSATGHVAIIVKEKVIVAGCSGHVWGLDIRTGEILWHNGLTGLGNSFVTLADCDSSVQYIHVQTHSSS